MNSLVLDSGALIRLERDDRRTWIRLTLAAERHAMIQVPVGAIAQAWRDGARQARLAQALRHCDEVALDGTRARAAGVLCGVAHTSDVVDASVVIAAATLDRAGPTSILTSDPDDIGHLVDVARSSANVVAV